MAETSAPSSLETQKTTVASETEQEKRGIVERTRQKAVAFARHIREQLRRNPNPEEGLKVAAGVEPERMTPRERQDVILGTVQNNHERDKLLRETLTPATEIVRVDTPDPDDTTMKQFEDEAGRTKAPQETILQEQTDVPEWIRQGSIPLRGETPDPDLDRWERLMDDTDGDPDVVPIEIQKKVLARTLKRTEALRRAARSMQDTPPPALSTLLEEPKTEQTPQMAIQKPSVEHLSQELTKGNKALQKQLNNHTRELIRAMQLNGLNLADLQQHPELFRIDSQDVALLETLDQATLDEMTTPNEDPLLQSIRVKLLADDPHNPNTRYATIISSLHLATESTATDLRAQHYLKYISQNNGDYGLADAIRLDREKIQMAGGSEGDLSEVKQRMLSMGGMTLNAHEADNLLNTLEQLL